MKKKILAIIMSALLVASLDACSSAETSSSALESSAPSVSTTDSSVSETVSSQEDSSVAESSEEDATPTSEYYFKDNVVVTEDVQIEITDYKVIPVGEAGNEYGDAPVIAFWYSTTNRSGKEDITPMMAWIAIFSAVQDNDPNMVNELEVGMMPDDAYLDTQMAEIKPDGTVDCAISYVLDDETTPVTLTATKGILGEELGSQNFEIAQ